MGVIQSVSGKTAVALRVAPDSLCATHGRMAVVDRVIPLFLGRDEEKFRVRQLAPVESQLVSKGSSTNN